RGLLILNGRHQRRNGGVELVFQNGLSQIAADDLDRLGRGLLHPSELARLPQDGAEATSHLDADSLKLGEGGGRLRVVGRVAVNAALGRVDGLPEVLKAIVALEPLSSELDSTSGSSVELVNHLRQGLNRRSLNLRVKDLHIGKSHVLLR